MTHLPPPEPPTEAKSVNITLNPATWPLVVRIGVAIVALVLLMSVFAGSDDQEAAKASETRPNVAVTAQTVPDAPEVASELDEVRLAKAIAAQVWRESTLEHQNMLCIGYLTLDRAFVIEQIEGGMGPEETLVSNRVLSTAIYDVIGENC